MKSKITLECDIYEACRTNTGRAAKSDGHYDFPMLAKISRAGISYEDFIADLQWCAENQETDMAINSIRNFAEAMLSAYEIQEKTYKTT